MPLRFVRSTLPIVALWFAACEGPPSEDQGNTCAGRYWMFANGHRLEVVLHSATDGSLQAVLREAEVLTQGTGWCAPAAPGVEGELSWVRTDPAGLPQAFEGTYQRDEASGQLTMQGLFESGDDQRPFFGFTLLSDEAVTIRSVDEAEALRQEVIRYLWGRDDLPVEVLPSEVEREAAVPLSGLGPELGSVDALTVAMSEGFRARVFHLHPAEPVGRLMIVHQGHWAELGAAGMDRSISSLLSLGFDVLALYMPALGPNDNPMGAPGDHSFVRWAPPTDPPGRRISYFIEPVIVSLNHVVGAADFEWIGMMGLSGGGWTTVLSAALDPRIQVSFPVAGSLPLAMRTSDEDVGDWEQFEPALYQIAGYADLYILGAAGPGRVQIQIHNQHDPCCFAESEPPPFAEDVQDAVAALGVGGSYQFRIDLGQTEHTLSDWTLHEVIEPEATRGLSPP